MTDENGENADELIGAALCNADDDIILVSKQGMSLKFEANDEQLRPMGRQTAGVQGMKFRDGDELLVEYTPEIREGEIGIFVVAGEGFVKEYRSDGLHSHNPKYKPIRPMQDDNFRCVGRVLGAVTEDMLATPQELAVLSEVYSS